MIWLRAGGSRSPSSRETVDRHEHFIRMEGRETYRFATRTLASTALASIRKAGLAPADIDLFVPHQANIRIIDELAKQLEVPESVVVARDIVYTGNTSAASVPLAMDALLESGAVKSGGLALEIGFGAGLAFAAQVVVLP